MKMIIQNQKQKTSTDDKRDSIKISNNEITKTPLSLDVSTGFDSND